MRAKISPALERLLADPVKRREIIPSALGRKRSVGGFNVVVVGAPVSAKKAAVSSTMKDRIGSNR